MKQQAIRTCVHGIRNPGTKAEYSFQPLHAVDAHPEIDDDEIRIPREIYRASIDSARHEAPPPPLRSASSRHRCAIAQGTCARTPATRRGVTFTSCTSYLADDMRASG